MLSRRAGDADRLEVTPTLLKNKVRVDLQFGALTGIVVSKKSTDIASKWASVRLGMGIEIY